MSKTDNSGRLQRLTKSPLVRALILGFVLLALIDSIFIGLLCYELFKAEQRAAHHYDILKASETLSHLAERLRKHRRIVDDSRFIELKPSHVRTYWNSVAHVKDVKNSFLSSWKTARLDTKTITELAKSVDEMCLTSWGVFDPAASVEQREKSFQRYLGSMSKLYKQSSQEMRQLLKLLKVQKELAQDPSILLFVLIAVNLTLCVFVCYLVDRSITRPIISLAKRCHALSRGEQIPAPVAIKNEIGQLESTFHQMAKKVSENEQRRRSYLQYLKEVQTKALASVLDGINQLSKSQTLPGKRVEELFVIMKESTEGLISLVQSIAEGLSFESEEEVSISVDEVDLCSLCEQASASVSALAEKNNIRIKIECQSKSIVLDKHLITRVLINFLSNAIKYSGSGSEIVLRTETGIDGVERFSVIDTGPGISEENQKKLFKKFSQTEASDGVKREGTGLGLLICKQIVEAHGGEVGVESAIGSGSTFWFNVPSIALKSPSLHSLSVHKSSSSKSSSNGKGEQIEDGAPSEIGNRKTRLPISNSIIKTFILVLVVFVLGQSLLAIQLHTKFEETSQRLSRYVKDEDRVVASQALFTQFLTWRDLLKQAAQEWNMPILNALTAPLDRQVELARSIQDSADKNSQSKKMLQVLQEHYEGLQVYWHDAIAQMKPDLEKSEVENQYRDGQKRIDILEDDFFDLLALERKQLDQSYLFAAQLRHEILLVFALSALLNFAILAAIAISGLRIIDRITVLNEKAREFANGGTPHHSIESNDELALLDKQLCTEAELIREAEAQRQQLMAVINHDLRTPLTSILNGLEMISMGVYGELNESEQQLAKRTQTRLSKLFEQITDLLALEKIESGKFEPEFVDLEILPCLENLIDELQLRWEMTGVNLELQQEVQASPMDNASPIVRVDRALLERIITALVENAIAASVRSKWAKSVPAGDHDPSASGGTAKSVVIVLSHRDKQVQISIEDKGDGISESFLSTLFDRFRVFEGRPITGLGLPLAMKYSQLLGAKLEVLRSSSEGTVMQLQMLSR